MIGTHSIFKLTVLLLTLSSCGNKGLKGEKDVTSRRRNRKGGAFTTKVKKVIPPKKPKLSSKEVRELEEEIFNRYGMNVVDKKKGNTLLHILARKGDLEGIKLIFKHPKIDINAVGVSDGRQQTKFFGKGTALHFAKDGPTAELLVKLGADLKAAFSDGNSATKLIKKDLTKYPPSKDERTFTTTPLIQSRVFLTPPFIQLKKLPKQSSLLKSVVLILALETGMERLRMIQLVYGTNHMLV